jgi:hypothetical protein
MADYSLVPVDHQPDFADASLVPVEHDPFGTNSGTKTDGAASGDIAGRSEPAPPVVSSGDNNRQVETKSSEPADGSSAYSQAKLAPSRNGDRQRLSGSNQQYGMASQTAHSKCVDKCLHLLRSPSGDLQSSEFRLCVGQCMGRL